MSVVPVKQVSVTRSERARCVCGQCKWRKHRSRQLQPPPFVLVRALSLISRRKPHPAIDLLPALDLLVFDLELCLIPAALAEEGEGAPKELFPAANTPEFAYELYRGDDR